MQKLKKYMKSFGKNKDSSCPKYWDVNNLYGWEMSQKLPVDSFEWVENTSQLYKLPHDLNIMFSI